MEKGEGQNNFIFKYSLQPYSNIAEKLIIKKKKENLLKDLELKAFFNGSQTKFILATPFYL